VKVIIVRVKSSASTPTYFEVMNLHLARAHCSPSALHGAAGAIIGQG
jgi:hypothetical protein